jgi:hypothetical protein
MGLNKARVIPKISLTRAIRVSFGASREPRAASNRSNVRANERTSERANERTSERATASIQQQASGGCCLNNYIIRMELAGTSFPRKSPAS